MLKEGHTEGVGGQSSVQVILWALVEVTCDWRNLCKEEPASQHSMREMGRACGTCEGEEKCIWGFGRNQ